MIFRFAAVFIALVFIGNSRVLAKRNVPIRQNTPGLVEDIRYSSMRFSPDGRTLASVRFDQARKTAALFAWDIEPGKLKRERNLKSTRDWPAFMPFLKQNEIEIRRRWGEVVPNGVTWHEQRQIWNLATNAVTPLTTHINAIAVSPDGTLWAKPHEPRPLLGNSATDMMSAEKTLYTLPTNDGALAFSPDGKTLATFDFHMYSDTDDIDRNDVRLWDAQSGQLLRTWTGPRISYALHRSHPVAESLRFSPDGRTLIAVGSQRRYEFGQVTGGIISFYDVQSEGVKPLRQADFDSALPRECKGVALAPDGKTLAFSSSYNAVRLWDVTTQKTTWTLRGSHREKVRWNTPDPSVEFSPDSQLLAANDGAAIRLWNIATGKLVRSFR